MTKFFNKEWILSHYNTNINVLIPKGHHANIIGQFTPISLENLKHKVTTKIIVDRLTSIMPHIISNERNNFIKGRSIKDYICLTYKAINILNKKCYGRNVALKIDIPKAFDSLN